MVRIVWGSSVLVGGGGWWWWWLVRCWKGGLWFALSVLIACWVDEFCVGEGLACDIYTCGSCEDL